MIQTIDISLIPSDNKPVINVSQYDNVLRVLRFNVFDDIEMEVPHVFDDTETVLLNIRKNDNNIVVITGEIVTETEPEPEEVTEQYLTFELTEQACACVGSNYGEVSITNGDDEVIGSCNFKLVVERSPLAGGVESQSEIDTLTTQIESITEQVIGENYYTKIETDNLLNGKANANNVYTKIETDNLLNGKANADNVYTKIETDNLLNGKANADNVYTKIETDNNIAALINDDATVNDKTWSSEKISDELEALLPVGTASGSIASFNTAFAKPLVSCVVDENATKVIRCGKNTFDINYLSGAGITISDGVVSGILVNFNNNFGAGINKLKFLPLTSYSISFRAKNETPAETGSGLSIAFIYTDNSRSYVICPRNTSEYTQFSGSSNSAKTVKDIAFTYVSSGGEIWFITDIQVEQGAPTNYETYNGTEYSIPYINNIITLIGDNNIFSDVGDVTVQYKDTIQNYIDTRVNAVSSRSLSMMRTLETFESDGEIERGETDDQR